MFSGLTQMAEHKQCPWTSRTSCSLLFISCSLAACFHSSISRKSFSRRVTLETGGSGLPQREEDVTHDSGTANAGGGDDVEDAVYVMTKVFLRKGEAGQMCQIPTQRPNANKQTQTHTPLRTLFVSRFSDSLSLTGSISQGLCSVQICKKIS